MNTIKHVSRALGLAFGFFTMAASASVFTIPDNPLWTDTGIALRVGDQVSITASGLWDFGVGPVGPGGTPNDPSPYDRFSSAANHGALIGYIGGNPLQGHYGDGSFFPQATGYLTVGTSLVFTSGSQGEFWLGCNDDAVSQSVGDNSGSFTVQLSVIPEPTALGLFVLGVGFAGVWRGRRNGR